MRRTIWLFCFLAVSVAGMAQATPPQVVSVRDILLGANETHIFLLRSLDDNMGGYTQTQTDLLLVARNRGTNRDDDIWPVARGIEFSPFEDAPPEGRAQSITLDGAVNPFDILSTKGAWLLTGVTYPARATRILSAEPDQPGVTMEFAGTRYEIAYTDVSRIIMESLERSRAILPPFFAEGGIDALQGVRIDPQIDCTFEASANIVDGYERLTQLVIVTCQNDETIAPISTYLVMPRV
jgi:hypothetical protein